MERQRNEVDLAEDATEQRGAFNAFCIDGSRNNNYKTLMARTAMHTLCQVAISADSEFALNKFAKASDGVEELTTVPQV